MALAHKLVTTSRLARMCGTVWQVEHYLSCLDGFVDCPWLYLYEEVRTATHVTAHYPPLLNMALEPMSRRASHMPHTYDTCRPACSTTNEAACDMDLHVKLTMTFRFRRSMGPWCAAGPALPGLSLHPHAPPVEPGLGGERDGPLVRPGARPRLPGTDGAGRHAHHAARQVGWGGGAG